MKNLLLLLLVSFILSFLGCKKEKINQSPQATTTNESLAARNQSYQGVTVANKMLNFLDLASFRKVYESLESAYDGPNENVLEQFEINFDYISLRSKVEKLQFPWLETEELDENLDPSNNYIQGQILRTLLNEKSSVQIGKSIFVIVENFDAVEITDSNNETYLAVLAGLRKGDNIVYYQNDGTALIGGIAGKPTSDCVSYGYKTASMTYNSSKRKLNTKVWVFNLPFYAQAGAESDHYKKKNNGGWSHDKASSLSAGLVGTLYDLQCKDNGVINFTKTQSNKKNVTLTYTYWGQIIRYKKNGFGGSGKSIDGGTGVTSILL